MPVVKAFQGAGLGSEEEALKRQLLDKIASSTRRDSASEQLISKDEDEEEDSLSSDEEDGGASVGKVSDDQIYEEMIQKTRDIPLQKMIFTAEGTALFDELCLRIDVNQRYADFLPQWTDVAHLLEVDNLRTKWVETCVRPREGLTRAMLEIYMKDGGTLGEVLDALLKLQCYDILETVRPKALRFAELHNMSSPFDPSENNNINEKYFSITKTLMAVLGNKDPCLELQKFRHGLKYSVSNTVQHAGLIQSLASPEQPNFAAPATPIRDFDDKIPQFKNEVHLDQFKKKLPDPTESKNKCKILLLFSKDGVEAADQFVDIAKSVQHPVSPFFWSEPKNVS